ncbi:MAG: hypothetical protein M3N45_07975 [Actinomycetota bacterium]|nr:hypothetical protein [Actinomycetota bacterium]
MRIRRTDRTFKTGRFVGGAALFAGAAVTAYALWWRKNPSACPYGLRFFVELPHPFITRTRLREILAPRLDTLVRKASVTPLTISSPCPTHTRVHFPPIGGSS